MKKLLKLYRRLYRKLFFLYAPKDTLAYNGHTQACEAFFYITGEDYEQLMR